MIVPQRLALLDTSFVLVPADQNDPFHDGVSASKKTTGPY